MDHAPMARGAPEAWETPSRPPLSEFSFKVVLKIVTTAGAA